MSRKSLHPMVHASNPSTTKAGGKRGTVNVGPVHAT